MANGWSGRIDGVERRALVAHADDRGTFTEVWRDEWSSRPPPTRWTLVSGAAHFGPDDATGRQELIVIEGRITARLYDVRSESSTTGEALVVEHGPDDGVLTIPSGVERELSLESDVEVLIGSSS